MPSSFLHDPTAVLDYVVDWTAWLASGETISVSTWTVPAGITQTTPAPSTNGTKDTIWLTGGTIGTEYTITNHITTTAGRQNERSFVVSVVDR